MIKNDVHAATPKNLRVFGLGLGVIFTVFAALSWRKGGATYPYWLGAASVFALLGLLRPMALAVVYRPWMKVVGVLGAVNGFILMAVVFYGVFTPYSIVLRLLGKDFLDEHLHTGDSYWKVRSPVKDLKNYERQF